MQQLLAIYVATESFSQAKKQSRMTDVVLARITLDDDVPEYMQDIIRCCSVISEDETGKTIKDYQGLINNAQFRSESK
jgi:hypothetical protein